MIEITFGVHSVQALLLNSQADSLQILYVQVNKQNKLSPIIQQAKTASIIIKTVEKSELDNLTKQGNHQGIAAQHSTQNLISSEAELMNSLNKELPAKATILVLDQVQDPHNVGACIRTANASNVMAIIAPKDQSSPLSPVAKKVACGAAAFTPFIRVSNLIRALKALKDLGFWIYGAAGEANQTLHHCKFSALSVIIVGAEAKGLRQSTRAHCDELFSIPMNGQVSSLNVSVATGVILFDRLHKTQTD